MFELNTNYELLYKSDEGDSQLVSLKQCFPKSYPDQYLSVLSKDGHELKMLESLNALSPSDKEVVTKYLNFKNFRMRITKILSVDEEFGVRVFKVVTDRGERIFQMAMQHWPYLNASDEVIFEDINSDVYIIDNFDDLDKKTRKYLYTYVE